MRKDIVAYDFEEINELLKKESVDIGLVTNSEYEGSNISQLMRVIAYAVQSANINTTFGVNEMMLTRTTQYKNILKLARTLGYIPKSKISYRCLVKLMPKKEGIHKIEKYTRFKNGEHTYYYFGADIDRLFQYYGIFTFTSDVTTGAQIEIGDVITLANGKTASITEIKQYPYDTTSNSKRLLKLDFGGTILKDDVTQTFKICSNSGVLKKTGTLTDLVDSRIEEIEIKEGELFKYSEHEDLNIKIKTDTDGKVQNYIDINYYDIEDNGVEMWVTHFDNTGQLKVKEEWRKRDYFIIDKDIFEEKSTFLPLVDIDMGTLRIYFTMAGTGITPKPNSKIFLNLLKTKGADGKPLKDFENDTLDNDVWSIVGEYKIKNIGSDVEDIESIRNNAPTFHNTGNRAVTRKDYMSICNRESVVKQTQCFGGEENYPVKYLGHIFLSFIPEYRPITFTPDATKEVYLLDYVDDKLFNLKDDEISSVTIQNNSNKDDSNSGIFDILEAYKIITMQLHEVKNYFLDVRLTVDVRKYFLTDSESNINEMLMDGIQEYFHNVVEKYDADFYKSNLIRVVDELLGTETGVDIKMDTNIPLYKEHFENVIDAPNAIKMDIWFGHPFDGLVDKYGMFNNEMMPKIDTPNFIENKELYIARVRGQEALGSGLVVKNDEVIELGIFCDDKKGVVRDYLNQEIPDTNLVGKCYVDNEKKTLLIRLYIKKSEALISGNDSMYYKNSILLDTHFDTKKVINVEYPFNDINFHRNTLPRLVRVEFV